ncbi:Dyp-type peroxidase [Kordiimonas marina]|uniref:Dyp-type peroxidase n=1 Tax=Kordiimonas marina TaxID=2872312 RepID=UPI001FF1C94D|nr:Dyp-type peroxidase domain-containing protein [Kordiimonas marina]MCJ9429329.1 Dyp-type peroxidase [Kordiimonas marina]
MTNHSIIDTKDVQALFRGIGLHWPKGRFFFCRYEDDAAGRKLLKRLGPLTSFHALKQKPNVVVNAAFNHAGLDMLKLDNDILNSLPDDFTDGMRRRADINGDTGESDPALWDDIWKEDIVHLWVGVYATDEIHLNAWCDDFTSWVEAADGASIVGQQDVSRIVSDKDVPVYIDDPGSQPQHPVLLEHFGFRDGMGNPAIKGLIEKHLDGAGALDPEGNWSALATGEFLLGHVDGHGEMPVAPLPEAFAYNGSFLVLRKLAQDVDLFRGYLTEQAGKLGDNADDIAARMVGRRRDGTPLIKGKNDYDFTYAGDPEGRVCPMGAHLRRANPRDSFGAQFGSALVDRHRILRRAITYGELVPHGKTQEEVNGKAGQGLIFLVLNASISRQFEFVQQQWINYGNDFDQGNDSDPITGLQNGDGQMVIPGDGDRQTMICDELKQFVSCRGGDYFFLPGINAFKALASESKGWRR